MTAVEAQFYWMSAKVPSDQFLLCSNDPPTSPHQHRPQTAIITPEWRSPGTPRSTGIDNFSAVAVTLSYYLVQTGGRLTTDPLMRCVTDAHADGE
jgi:hypothetical protein